MIFEGHFLNFQQIKFAAQDGNLGLASSVYLPTGQAVSILIGRSRQASGEIFIVPFGVLHEKSVVYQDFVHVDGGGRLTNRAQAMLQEFFEDLRVNAVFQFEDSNVLHMTHAPFNSEGVTVTTANSRYAIFLPSNNPYDIFRDPSVY